MLNEYLPLSLLKEELMKRDYLLSNVSKDNSWKGGNLIVPFKGGGASSVTYGSLTASDDIAEDTFVRGSLNSQPEVWGSMIFNHRDLMEHDRLSEQNFLKLLPDTIEDFMDRLKNVVSINLMNGSHSASLTADADDLGNLTVDRPERFDIGQKVIVDDDNSAPQSGYIQSIDINTGVLQCDTTRAGGTARDWTVNGYTTAQNAKVYEDGAQAGSFTSLRDQLLSSANGGAPTVANQTKTTYPFLQAIQVDGSGVTAANILEKIFDGLTDIRKLGKGRPTDIVMSYKNLGSVLKVLETSKGGFNVVPQSQKTSVFGWTEIKVGSVSSEPLKIVGVQEVDDDVVYYLDWRGLVFYSNGFIRRRRSPEGDEFYELRGTSGYQYIVDMSLFGDLVVTRPSTMGVMHSISY